MRIVHEDRPVGDIPRIKLIFVRLGAAHEIAHLLPHLDGFLHTECGQHSAGRILEDIASVGIAGKVHGKVIFENEAVECGGTLSVGIHKRQVKPAAPRKQLHHVAMETGNA